MNKSLRNCPYDSFDIELLLLKLAIRAAILSEHAVGYKDKILLLPPNNTADNFSIFRRLEPSSAVFVHKKRPAEAVDRFVLTFIYEQDLNVDDVRFYLDAAADAGATTWEHIKTHALGIQNLISASGFSSVLTGAQHDNQSQKSNQNKH